MKIQIDQVESLFDWPACFCCCSCRGLKAPLDIIPTGGRSQWCTVYGFCPRPSCWQDREGVRIPKSSQNVPKLSSQKLSSSEIF